VALINNFNYRPVRFIRPDGSVMDAVNFHDSNIIPGLTCRPLKKMLQEKK
jgi:hypothetical protein